MFRHLHKLSRLSLAEWRDLALAELALLRALRLVRTRPRGELVRAADGEREPDALAADDAIAKRARALGLAVERAAEYGPVRPHCLVRAIALERLLRSEGVEGCAVRVGVARRSEEFTAHAWVEYRGTVLGDRDWRIQHFDELSGIELSP